MEGSTFDGIIVVLVTTVLLVLVAAGGADRSVEGVTLVSMCRKCTGAAVAVFSEEIPRGSKLNWRVSMLYRLLLIRLQKYRYSVLSVENGRKLQLSGRSCGTQTHP
jgi:hypothetical protein